MAPARDRLLNAKEQGAVISAMMNGANLSTAAKYARVPRRRIEATRAASEDFQKRLESAEPQFEIAQLGNITAAAMREQYWRAAAWMLERKFPSRYGKKAPEALTPGRVKALLENLAEIVCAEVAEEETRAKILNRLQQLLARVRTGAKES